jgi:hypothetical protein
MTEHLLAIFRDADKKGKSLVFDSSRRGRLQKGESEFFNVYFLASNVTRFIWRRK